MNVTEAPMIPAPSVEALTAYPGSAWPLRSHLELPPRPSSVTSARHHARDLLARWRPGDPETVQLVVSELVTNAVRAGWSMTPGPHLRLWLCSDGDRVLVQVWDSNEAMPVIRDPGPDQPGGRGLMIVAAMAEDWGAYRPAAMLGKVTWAVVRGAES